MTATWAQTGGKSWRVVFGMPPSEERLALRASLGGLNAYRTAAATMVQGYLGANAYRTEAATTVQRYDARFAMARAGALNPPLSDWLRDDDNAAYLEAFLSSACAELRRYSETNAWVRGVSENSEIRPENLEKADRVFYSRPGWVAYLAPGTPQR